MNTTGYFKLGLFVLLAVFALIGGAIGLGAGKALTKSIPMETCFDESIAGLEVGASVKHRGVTVGHVGSIRFPHHINDLTGKSAEPFKYIVVEMEIDPQVLAGFSPEQIKDLIQRMVAGGRARITQSGITGSAYIELNYVNRDIYPLVASPYHTNEPFVPSAPGAFNQVVSAIEDITTKLQRANLDKVIGHADALLVHTDEAMKELQIADLRTRAVAVIDRVHQLLDDPAVNKVISDLPEISGRIRSMVTHVDELVKQGRFDEAATHLRQTLAQLDGLVASQSDSIRAIVDDLRATMDNARELTADVKADPSRLILAPPPPHANYGSGR